MLAVLTGMCLLVLGGCAPSKNKSNKLHIVTSLNFYGETAKAVVGKYGTVDEIINGPNVDPHDFEPTTNTAKSVVKADVIVYNGLGYDSWMQRLIESDSESGATKINVGGTVMGKKLTDNPHVWYNHQTMPKLAQKLAKVFAKKDPKHRKHSKKMPLVTLSHLIELTNKLPSLRRID